MTDTKGNAEFGPRSPRFPSSKFSAPKAGRAWYTGRGCLPSWTEDKRARLTLVVGSPGAGKTALLADWVASVAAAPICVAQL